MTFTLERLTDSIAGLIKERYPEVPVYSNPNQQGTKTPCFFIFFMPSEIKDEMDRRSRRVIGIDIVYLVKRNIPDAYDRLVLVADQLDDMLETIPYREGDKFAKLRTFGREWKIDDGELHYQITLKVIVSDPDDTPDIRSMESYEGGIKSAKSSENRQ